MENRIGNSDGAEIPKKSRSLDLKSLYKSKDSMASHNNKELKRKNSSGDGDEKSNKKKKSSKTVSISSLKNVDNSKGAVEEVYNGHLSSGLHDKKDKKLGLNHNWDNGSGFSGISLSLDDGGIQIPKRKRDFVGRKKVEVSKVLKPQSQSCSRVGSVDKVTKVTGNDSAPRVESPKNLATRVESSKDLVTQVKSSKDSGRQVESSKDTGRQVESSKNSVRQVESSKDTGRQVESSKDTGRQVESSKDSGRQVESSKDTGRQVESSKDTGRQVESSKNLGRQVESSKDLGRQVESSKVKRKKGFESFKENRNGESNSARNLTKEGAHASHLIVNHGESSVKKETINSESKSNRHLKGDGGHASNLVTINGDSSQKKSNRISSSNLAQDLKEDDRKASHLVVNNSDSSLKKSRRKNSKRKDSSRDRRSNAKEAEPLIETSVKVCDDLLEDEKNLEENAAMMLSSRFDPSCTGFSSNGKSIASKNGLSFMLSSGRDLHSHGSESASFDAAGRALRPRMEQKERGQSRKRRHYYEVSFGDLDAFWVLNRRIKVFWPLDQCWYYGLVNDYDKERKLHHVKYDDRDEEWINLENERFKLLLLPSDVPGKTARRRSRIKEKFSDEGKESLEPSTEMENRNLNTEDDKCMGSYMDSEPIISWLARSTRRVKSSPFHAMKKQKTSDPSLDSEPSLLFDEAVKAHGCLDGGYSERNTNKLSSQSELMDRFANDRRAEDSVSGSPTHSYDGKRPIVYYRRRLRKTRSMFSVSSPSYCLSSATPTYVTVLDPLFDGFGDVVEHDISQKRLNLDETLWSIDNAELFKLTIPLLESRQVRFELSYPVLSVLNYAFEAENLWLVRAVFLLHHGTLTTTGPRVHLEMLFVDNVSGLRFLLFEGCLKQVVAHVFLVLTVFRQTDKQGKYADLQLPVTSIRFKFSCIQDLRKQLVFAFYNFAEVKNSMWMYLDSKLKRRCLLDRQLPLSKCTFDNIKALQNGSNQSVATFLCGDDDDSTKGLPRRSRPSISLTDVLTKSTCGKASQFSSNSDKKQRKFSPFAISFAAAPTFFLSLHLKLLMEHSGAHSFRGHGLTERPESPSSLTADDCSRLEYCLDKGSESNPENIMLKSILGNTVKDTLMDAASDGCLSVANSELSAVGLSVHSNGHWVRSPQKMKNADVNVARTSTSSRVPEEIRSEGIQKWQGHDRKVEHALSPRPPVDKDKMDTGSRSPLNGIRVEIPTFDQFEKHADREFHSAQRSTDLSWNMNGGVIPSPNPTAPRSTWHRNRSSLSFGHLSHRWSDGKTDVGHSSFGTGPKKPRTQVSYSLPFGGFDYSSKNRGHNQKGVHHTRIRRPNEKRFSDVSRGSQKNLELSCNANVLITLGDKGRRECGAQIVLELFDHHEWKLAVKVSGMTRYSYKAHQFMQLGSTNRHTHAMMWKGGKDWTLEFPDRSQWALFKEMHEECYNRNVRAASVKNIPIPGVRLIEETDDYGAELAFVRCSSRYFRQVETDVEMGLNPSRILYDMDSDDEQWILKNCNSSEADNKGFCEISEEMFEKTIDMFEKAAYSQQRDQFTSDDIEELTAGVGSMEAIKTIHEYWRQKRKKKGMPLIRHLQPPLWERYQQQVREWEIAMSKINTTFPNGYQEKVAPVEKPGMSAFCLKPRGLEVPNKGSKQRSHRRISVSGQSHIGMGDHDGFHPFGRRLNGFAFGDEKVVYPGHNYESLDDSPLSQTSPRMFSPRVFSPHAGSMDYFSMSTDGFDRNQYQKHQRSKSKRMFDSSYDSQMAASCNQRLMVRRNGIHRWNMDYSDWPSQRPLYSDGSLKHGPEQFDGSDLDEFRLRDASGAAQHARNIAKLKREKAQRLLYRADLAVHKAVAALMTAEAIKASYDDDVNSDE